MRIRRWLYILLSLLLLWGLSACQREEKPPSSQSSQGTSFSIPEGSVSIQQEEPEPEPEPEPGAWDPEHTLCIAYDPVVSGKLELPVRGATGYASVELPLWETVPKPEPEPEPKPEPKPVPEPEPEPEPDPEPEPEPEQKPDTSASVDGSASLETPTSAEDSALPEISTPAEDSALPEISTPAEGSALPEISAPADGIASPEPSFLEDSAAPLDVSASGGSSAPTEAPSPDVAVAESGSTSPAVSSEPEEMTQTEGEFPAATDPGVDTDGQVEEQKPDASLSPVPEPEPEPDPYEGALAVLAPGTAFTVLKEEGEWWQVRAKGVTGWIEHHYCMINLPDVIPSILYDAVNAYDAKYVSSGQVLPGVTGESLYAGAVYNPRLDRKEFLMPVLYAMAPKICAAQQNALAQGHCLILYEGYRPYSTQRAVVKSLSALAKEDSQVKAGIATPPWNISWFIATGYSNHQRGFAIDVGLAKIQKAELRELHGRTYLRVLEHEVYQMPTPIHELSQAAATFTAPVASLSSTAWKSAELSPSMNEAAMALQNCCTNAGLTPLASEWWHFNDLNARRLAQENLGTGGFQVKECLSQAP